MAFRVSSKKEPLLWPVTVSVPVSGGEFEKFEFVGHFCVLSMTERGEIIDAHDKAMREKGADVAALNADTFSRLMTGWDGVIDSDGKPIEFTRENLKIIFESPDAHFVTAGLWASQNEISLGIPRAKN